MSSRTQELSLPLIRLVLCIVLLFVEAFILSLLVDARSISMHGVLGSIISNAGYFLRWLIISTGILALYLSRNFRVRLSILFIGNSSHSAIAPIIFHLGMFVCLVLLTPMVFSEEHHSENYTILLWVILAGLVGFFWALIITTVKNWTKFLTAERSTITLAFVSGLVIVLAGVYSQRYWASTS